MILSVSVPYLTAVFIAGFSCEFATSQTPAIRNDKLSILVVLLLLILERRHMDHIFLNRITCNGCLLFLIEIAAKWLWSIWAIDVIFFFISWSFLWYITKKVCISKTRRHECQNDVVLTLKRRQNVINVVCYWVSNIPCFERRIFFGAIPGNYTVHFFIRKHQCYKNNTKSEHGQKISKMLFIVFEFYR